MMSSLVALVSDPEWAEVFVALFGVVITFFTFVWAVLSHKSQQAKLIEVQRQQTYQRLELASNEVFRFWAENAAVIVPHISETHDPALEISAKDRLLLENAIYQTLNLFEMAARLRQADVFEHEVFGSWVAWYYELLAVRYFRDKWFPEFRDNYTREMRQIFDKPVRAFDSEPDDAKRKQEFFNHVATELKCPVVGTWLTGQAA